MWSCFVAKIKGLTVVTNYLVTAGFISDACCGAFTVFTHRSVGDVTGGHLCSCSQAGDL